RRFGRGGGHGRRARPAPAPSRARRAQPGHRAQRGLRHVGPRRASAYRRAEEIGDTMDPIAGRSLARSREYFARARKVIPSCTQTFSKGHTQFVQGVAPLFLQRGRGSHVWDVDGNEYVDYVMALGPIVLGYDDPDVLAAVRALTHPFTYDDLGSLERIFAEYPGRIAAVIMEPVGVVEPARDFLQRVATLTHTNGAVLIFDEIVTGFRLALGGAQERFGVTPDLACFGKAMANGFPLSAVVGRREIMEVFDEIFFSFTFGGEALSLAAARATIAKLREKNVIEHLWRQGTALRDGYTALAREHGIADRTRCIGLPPRTVLTFKDAPGADSLAMKSLFQQEMIKRGILTSGGFNVCYAHSDEDVRRTLAACGDALFVLARALAEDRVEAALEGPAIQPVFRSA